MDEVNAVMGTDVEAKEKEKEKEKDILLKVYDAYVLVYANPRGFLEITLRTSNEAEKVINFSGSVYGLKIQNFDGDYRDESYGDEY